MSGMSHFYLEVEEDTMEITVLSRCIIMTQAMGKSNSGVDAGKSRGIVSCVKNACLLCIHESIVIE